MATGNIDCNIPDALFRYSQPLNLNHYNHGMQECEDEESAFMMESTQSNIRDPTFPSAHTIEDFASKIIMDHAQSMVDTNENPTNTLPVLCINGTPSNRNENNIDNNENSLLQEGAGSNTNFPLPFNLPEAMPEELFINVDSDDEGVHSWRPNMTSDTLCSDFFMMTNFFQNDSDIRLPIASVNDKVDYYKEANDSFKWTTSNAENSIIRPEVSSQPAQSTARIDIESHIHDQMAGLNIVKYEIINAQRKAKELREELTNLEHKLNERLNLQKTFDVKKLKSENSQLRIECQCLFMEVDYYERDSLGKADAQSQHGKETGTKDEAHSLPSNQSNDNDDQDDNQKWDCHKCTFSNHPAINYCEMCQTQRLSAESLSPYLVPSRDSCFCHPKTESS